MDVCKKWQQTGVLKGNTIDFARLKNRRGPTMTKVMIDSEFWEIFPDAQIHLLIAQNIDQSIEPDTQDYFVQLLNESKQEAAKFLTDETFSNNPVIQEWREAFQKFKTKKGARSSIEALLKRVNQGREFLPINPLVDMYNSVSMKYAVPMGGEDLDTIEGDLHLGKAKGGEPFFPLGADKDSPALADEIIYYDDLGAICRCLNWREAQRTMLQNDTKNAILVIEAINVGQAIRADAAMVELKQLINDYFNIDITAAVLTKDHREFAINE